MKINLLNNIELDVKSELLLKCAISDTNFWYVTTHKLNICVNCAKTIENEGHIPQHCFNNLYDQNKDHVVSYLAINPHYISKSLLNENDIQVISHLLEKIPNNSILMMYIFERYELYPSFEKYIFNRNIEGIEISNLSVNILLNLYEYSNDKLYLDILIKYQLEYLIKNYVKLIEELQKEVRYYVLRNLNYIDQDIPTIFFQNLTLEESIQIWDFIEITTDIELQDECLNILIKEIDHIGKYNFEKLMQNEYFEKILSPDYIWKLLISGSKYNNPELICWSLRNLKDKKLWIRNNPDIVTLFPLFRLYCYNDLLDSILIDIITSKYDIINEKNIHIISEVINNYVSTTVISYPFINPIVAHYCYQQLKYDEETLRKKNKITI